MSTGQHLTACHQIVKKQRRRLERQLNTGNVPDASLNEIGVIILRRRCPARRHRRRPPLNRVTVGLGDQRLRKDQHRVASQASHQVVRVAAIPGIRGHVAMRPVEKCGRHVPGGERANCPPLDVINVMGGG